ncbi:MAG TPA: RNA polymerase sigma factor [Thermodesulfobacteriota bacterium]|nr:RNA polymerase sigma factor [Thermodesulfobacteriota bacterium]
MLTYNSLNVDKSNSISTPGTNSVQHLLNIFYKEQKHNYKEYTDEHLTKLYIENKDDEAINEIAFRYIDKIYRLTLSITKNSVDAEDVLQNIFLTLLEKIHYYRGDSKFSTWIYRVSINATYSFLRKKNRDKASMESDSNTEHGTTIDHEDHSTIPDETNINKEILDIVRSSIDSLPEKYRIVIELRDIEGLSNQEAADITDITLTAFKSRLLRARNMLFEKLSTILK